jgi:hypothetical protein
LGSEPCEEKGGGGPATGDRPLASCDLRERKKPLTEAS